jgi:hypothetical protein
VVDGLSEVVTATVAETVALVPTVTLLIVTAIVGHLS